MVWSHQDFARELHRQLVEIASIRKRVDGNSDLLERLSRLEESQHYLLRKLQERPARATSSESAAGSKGTGPSRSSKKRVYRSEPGAVSLRLSGRAMEEPPAMDGRCLTDGRSSRGRNRPAGISGERMARVPVDECFRSLRWKLEDLTKTAVEAVRLESRRRDHRGSSTE